MAKSKSGTALFDLLNKGDIPPEEQLQVPGWWSKVREQDDDVDESAEPEPLQEHIIQSASVEEESEPDDLSDFTDEELPTETRGSFIVMDREKIRVSFTSYSGAITLFIVLIVLAGTYEFGRTRGQRLGFTTGYDSGKSSFVADTMNEIESARKQPPATHVVRSLMTSPDKNKPRKTITSKPSIAIEGTAHWVRGFTYIVAQEFGRDYKQHADRAQLFLSDHDVDSAKIVLPNGSVQLITIQGFNRSDETQRMMADQLLDKIHKIGTQYFSSGGGYRLQGYFKTLKNDSWN